MTTLSDVARLAGVSPATASRALNDTPGRTVRPELRERVLNAARELNYLPNAAAQTMARGQSNSLGLLVNEISDPHFLSVASGVSKAAARYGCILTLSSAGIAAAARAEVVDLMTAQRVRALIIAGSIASGDPGLDQLAASLSRLAATGARIATIGAEQLGVSSVLLPSVSGSAALAEELLAAGYRRFAVLAGPANRLAAAQRADSFSERVRAGGGEILATIHGEYDRAAGYRGMDELLAGPLPELVFATNDLLALGALRRIREAGLVVPTDIALAGFGGGEFLTDVVPGITSVFMDTERAGELAVELVLGPGPSLHTVELGFELDLRESTRR